MPVADPLAIPLGLSKITRGRLVGMSTGRLTPGVLGVQRRQISRVPVVNIILRPGIPGVFGVCGGVGVLSGFFGVDLSGAGF